LSQNQDVLKPFLLACDTKNAKLVTISMGCLRELISHRAMPEVSRDNRIDLRASLFQTLKEIMNSPNTSHLMDYLGRY
jgi:hypothetical protein